MCVLVARRPSSFGTEGVRPPFVPPPRDSITRRRHHLPTNLPCRSRCPQRTGRSRSEPGAPFLHPPSCGLEFTLWFVGCVCDCFWFLLPAGLAAAARSEREDDRDQKNEFHFTPHRVWVRRFSLPRLPSRAPDVDWLEQPPCHLHDRRGRKEPTHWGACGWKGCKIRLGRACGGPARPCCRQQMTTRLLYRRKWQSINKLKV